VKIRFLGTGTSQGVPMIGCDCEVCISPDARDNRLRASILIEYANKVIQIDGGPDFRYQHLRANTKQLDAILITHAHKDHIAGLDDVRAFNYFMKKPMDIYCDVPSAKAIREDFSYSFKEDKYPGVPEINLIEITHNPFEIDRIKVIPIPVMHYKMSVLGYRIEDFCYITDANFISDESKAKMKGLKCLVINGLRDEKHISHFTLNEALAIIEEVKPEVAFITHISHQLGLYKDVEPTLPEGVHLGIDNMVVEF
jgi:phosphoribosyl 1,2-cyclic phosphate phosphodiesterase